MPEKKPIPIKPAQLEWRGQDPVSLEYGDIYFSTQDGLAESRQVFLQGNQLADRWQQLNGFVIAETGFGSGLNFLAACKLWLDLVGETAQLHYYAVEKHPLPPSNLKQILSAYPALHGLLEPLLQSYPPLTKGSHKISLYGGRVSLTLDFMDIKEWLQRLNIKADAWFLDGFAPARNPAMWAQPVLEGIARNTSERGSFATFTAAGKVRRGLQRAGFNVRKTAGFGGKREMLQGELA
jgi:tRNA 5-methylaminomethyl-2-thiouridine biosynthesis bifunctional protein